MSKATSTFRYAIVSLPEGFSGCDNGRPGIIHLVPSATLENAEAICKGLKVGRPAIVHERLVRKPVWVGPHKLDTEDCWVPEFTYEVV